MIPKFRSNAYMNDSRCFRKCVLQMLEVIAPCKDGKPMCRASSRFGKGIEILTRTRKDLYGDGS